MKDVLTLIIEQKYFDLIMSGEKKEEYRSFTDYYINRFCEFAIEDGEEVFTGMKPIKHIKLAVGYRKDRKWAIIEVKGLFLDTFNDYLPEGFEKGAQAFTIELGNVAKTNF